jgi:hypothetical protein
MHAATFDATLSLKKILWLKRYTKSEKLVTCDLPNNTRNEHIITSMLASNTSRTICWGMLTVQYLFKNEYDFPAFLLSHHFAVMAITPTTASMIAINNDGARSYPSLECLYGKTFGCFDPKKG